MKVWAVVELTAIVVEEVAVVAAAGVVAVVVVVVVVAKGVQKKNWYSKNCHGSGGGMICPRRLSFSQFGVLMSTSICENDSLLGQTIPPPEP